MTDAALHRHRRVGYPQPAPGRVSWAAVGVVLTVLGAAATLWFVVALPSERASELNSPVPAVMMTVGMCGLATAGWVLARQQRHSVMAWLMLGTALAWVASHALLGVAVLLAERSGPGQTVAGWVTNWSWVPAHLLSLVTLLRFPTGRLPGPRWRWVERALLTWAVATLLVTAALPGPLGAEPLAPATNPWGLRAVAVPLETALSLLFAVMPVLVIAAAAAPALRWRRAHAPERRQLVWVAGAALLVALSAPLAIVSESGEVLQGLAFLLLPGAIGIAVVREQLWDLDLRQRFDRLRSVREHERERLRRELHDSLGPLLGSISMRAEAARNLLGPTGPGRVDDLLASIGADTEGALGEVRRLIDELGPSALEDQDLATALRTHLARYDGAFTIRLTVGDEMGALDARTEEAAYLIVAEAVRNAARHSGASGCEVRVDHRPDLLVVAVADDGVGLRNSPAGVGRRAMARRAESVGGLLTLTKPPTGGVVVRAELPRVVR